MVGGGVVDDNLELVHLLRAVSVEFGLHQAEFAAHHGMHPTDVRALICLLDAERAGEAATAGLLGARLGLNSAGTTAVIDRLERLGHVARVRDGADRRRVLLRVEPEAVRLGRAFFGPLIDRLLAVQGTLDPTEREAVRRFLTAARAALGEQEPGEPKRGEGQ
ncbi:MarR family winged helix-turn-helix transcriptional regulator [Streptomyces sp. H27-H5]|uniref:MarR family winged helix-turn-helix transcriptional regulator n=1 Tax=Streptomyces sp. H27-H5 TaxID=2996460 RepID=UPI00226EE32B|nr:MarR family winged helix-turn-helix transcriptional regulator [Streptomyces sp. H27-H5]MCY0958202.1 MarR family winged helix-turn-helix transcriptional regulator [Streptomyces sp. H27-H5]